MATVPGLQTGKVVKLENDPTGEYRILLQLISVKAEKEVWARFSNFDAGNRRGAYFLPEIGDEVLVGFINDDWSQPVVIGMLYSKERPPVRPHRDTNHLKSFTSRSGMHIQLDDETKKIEIKTPAGNLIVLDESGSKVEIKDQSANSILFDKSGIKIKSTKDITIESSASLNLRSGSSLTIEGNEIEIRARGNLKMNGANVSSSANANNELKGSVIKIN